MHFVDIKYFSSFHLLLKRSECFLQNECNDGNIDDNDKNKDEALVPKDVDGDCHKDD